jgi:hypothetical protein
VTGNYTYDWFTADGTKINQTNSSAINLISGSYYVIVSDSKNCQLKSNDVVITQPDLLSASISQQSQNLCFGNSGASLQISVVGGVAPYSYKWFSNTNTTTVIGTAISINNLASGTYFAIVTDTNNNIIQTANSIIVDPTVISNYLTADYVRCGDAADWTIRANSEGGTPEYSYFWNNGGRLSYIENVIPGTYSVLVKDKNGCETTNSITVNAPAHLDASEELINPTCFEGSDASIDVTVIDGTPPYSYSWNTGATTNKIENITAANYQVTITDSRGCVISRDYTITDPKQYIINLGDDMTLCVDQSAVINATVEDENATYLWSSDHGYTSTSPIITISEAAKYTLAVTNSLGCVATDDLNIDFQDSAIDATFIMPSQVYENETFYSIDISNPAPDAIDWIVPEGGTLISNQEGYLEMSFDKAGEYDITLVSKLGDCTATQTKTIVVTEGELESSTTTTVNQNKDLIIYPNPSDGNFTVEWSSDDVTKVYVKVYSLVNNSIIASQKGEEKNNYEFVFNLSGTASGVYFVLVETDKGNMLRKIIIQ